MSTQRAEMPIDPKRCAKARELCQGRVPLASFNLPAVVLQGSEEVCYKLKFGVDSEGYVFINGCVEAALQLQCQRCLRSVEYNIHSEFHLSPVQNGENAATLPDRYDAVLMEHDKLSVRQLVEDELILSLPIAPMHNRECHRAG